jgi:DNA-binding MarR family transcriptional regulator
MSAARKKETGAGRYAYEGLDRVIHEKARLGILTSLVTQPEGILFPELKELCALTDGNLNRHLKVLQEAGLVEVWKRHEQQRPQTLCRITSKGRERFVEYLAVLEGVVSDAATRSTTTSPRRGAPNLKNGWSPA